MSVTTDLLKGLYNRVQMEAQTQQGYATHATDALTRVMAQSKLDAYTDVCNQIMALLSQQIP